MTKLRAGNESDRFLTHVQVTAHLPRGFWGLTNTFKSTQPRLHIGGHQKPLLDVSLLMFHCVFMLLLRSGDKNTGCVRHPWRFASLNTSINKHTVSGGT